MRRGAWLRLVGRLLYLTEGEVLHIYRTAHSLGLISKIPVGGHAPPLDMRERKDLLEIIAISEAVGLRRLKDGSSKFMRLTVEWKAAGLVVNVPGGISRTVIIPSACLEILLAPDLS